MEWLRRHLSINTASALFKCSILISNNSNKTRRAVLVKELISQGVQAKRHKDTPTRGPMV